MCTLTLLLKNEKQKQMIKDLPCDEPYPLLYTHTKIHYIMYNVEVKYAHQVENNLSTPKLPTHQFVFYIKIHRCTTLFISKGWTFGFCKSHIVFTFKNECSHLFNHEWSCEKGNSMWKLLEPRWHATPFYARSP